MKTEIETPRATMNGKPVYEVPAKSVINFDSGFKHKLLCDGPTFSTGTACAYTCSFCYVPSQMKKSPHLKGIEQPHEDVVIRRKGAIPAMRSQLLTAKGQLKFTDETDRRVIYSSPLVDIAANMELVRETVEACRLILDLTHWQIRLLSKSNLLPQVAKLIDRPDAKERIIYGVSSGTLDDGIARVFEEGAALVSKRIQSIHALQDSGHRTFGMVCPSLPQQDYSDFADKAFTALRATQMEHVWAEVINVRGESMNRTCAALKNGGFEWEANELRRVSQDQEAWEQYSRDTFAAHAAHYAHGKLRFLQYVTKATKPWWSQYESIGAVLL